MNLVGVGHALVYGGSETTPTFSILALNLILP